MKPAHVAPIDADDAGFAPSETLMQTSSSRVRLCRGASVIRLPNVALPAAVPVGYPVGPDGKLLGYVIHEVTVLENPGAADIEWCAWQAAEAAPAHWTGDKLRTRHSVRLSPSHFSLQGAAVLIRAVADQNLVIRRGYAVALSE